MPHHSAHGAASIYACHPTSTSTLDLAPINKANPSTQIIPYPIPPTSEPLTLALIDEVLNAHGRLDVYVCCCLSSLLGPPTITTTTPADLQKCFEANTLVPFFALKYGPAAMQKTTTQRSNYPNSAPKDIAYGSIIIVTSTASMYGGCWGPAFTLASHATLGLVHSGVSVLKGTGVRINCISAGTIDIGLSQDTPARQNGNTTSQSKREQYKDNIGLERAGTPTEVARVAGFLASGFSSYVTGANMVVDGGSSIIGGAAVPPI